MSRSNPDTLSLSEFDNKTFPAFTHQGRNLVVRILTNPESVKENAEAVKLLGPIAAETQRRFVQDLKKEGVPEKDLENLIFEKKFQSPDPEDFAKNKFPQKFGQPDNYTAIILEEALEDGTTKALSAMSFTINDPKKRECVKITEDTPIIFFDLSQTLPEYSGQNFLKLMRSYLLPDLLIRAAFPEEIFMGTSMKRMKAINSATNATYEIIPNFPIHGKIFNFISQESGENLMLQRWREKGEEVDFSLEDSRPLPVSDFFKADGNPDNSELSTWIESSKASHDDKHLEGCFMRARVNSLSRLRDRACDQLLTREVDGKLKNERTPGQTPTLIEAHAVSKIEVGKTV